MSTRARAHVDNGSFLLCDEEWYDGAAHAHCPFNVNPQDAVHLLFIHLVQQCRHLNMPKKAVHMHIHCVDESPTYGIIPTGLSFWIFNSILIVRDNSIFK